MYQHQHLAAKVKQFINGALAGSGIHLSQFLAARVRCWGFPEFDPSNCPEYQGFFNYLIDVFAQREWIVEPLLLSETHVLVRFGIAGYHHEDFMGLPATGAYLEFNSRILFRVRDGLIEESWMYKKSLRLISKKGDVFELVSPAMAAAEPRQNASRR